MCYRKVTILKLILEMPDLTDELRLKFLASLEAGYRTWSSFFQVTSGLIG